MKMIRLTTIGAALTLLATPSLAWHHHHRSTHTSAYPAHGYAYPAYAYGSQPFASEFGWQAEAIAHATAAQQAAPGLTEELAPDAKETATGGPVGGVPGFSGR